MQLPWPLLSPNSKKQKENLPWKKFLYFRKLNFLASKKLNKTYLNFLAQKNLIRLP